MKKAKGLTIGLGIASLLSSMFAVSSVSAATADQQITPIEAKKAALYQVLLDQHTNGESNWKNHNIKLSDPIPVYDNTDTLSSYIVNLTYQGAPAGFVEVAANRDESPILSFATEGQSMSVDQQSAIKTHRKHNEKTIKSQSIVETGPADFGIKMEYNDGTAEVLNKNGSFELTIDKNVPKPKKNLNYNDGSRKDWNLIDGLVSGSVDYTGDTSDGVTGDLSFETGTATTYKVSGIIPNYKQWYYDPSVSSNPWKGYSGCVPTAASDIVYYMYDNNGYANVIDSSWDNTIVDLRQSFGTFYDSSSGDGETPIANLTSGMLNYLKAHADTNAYVYTTTSPSFSTVKSVLLYNNPDLLTFVNDTYFSNGNGGHTVCGIGTVEYSNGHQYMTIRNNQRLAGPPYNQPIPNEPTDIYVLYGQHYTTLYSTKVVY